MKNKLLRILLAVVLTLGIFPSFVTTAKADSVVLTNCYVGYETRGVALRPGMTGRQVSLLFQEALDNTYLFPGTHYDRSYCSLAYKDSSGNYIRLTNSDAELSDSREYYFVINVEEDDGYCWDVNNLPNALFNGNTPDDVRWYGGAAADGSIDVFKRVYIDASADYVSSVTVSPYRIKIQKGSDKTVSAEVNGTVSTVQWTMYNNKSGDSFVSNTGRIIVASDERADYLIVRATSTYNPYVYDEIEVTVSSEPVYITKVIVDPNPVNIVAGSGETLYPSVDGTELPDFTWKLSGNENSDTKLTVYSTYAYLYVSKTEPADTLTITCTSLHVPTVSVNVPVYIERPEVITDVSITYDPSTIILDTSMTRDDVEALLQAALRDGTITGGACIDYDYSRLYYRDGDSYVRAGNSNLESEKEYYVSINLEDNYGFMWDTDNIPNITVNGGLPDDVRWYGSPSLDGSIDVFMRVYLDEELPDAHVYFDKNGGSGTMSSVAVKIGRVYTIPECAFMAPSGYLFNYWQCDLFSGGKVVPGDTVTIPGDITLKAIWRKGVYSAAIHPIPTSIVAPGYSGNYYLGDVEVENTGDFSLSCNSSSFYVTDTEHFYVYFAGVPGAIPVGGYTTTIGLFAKNGLAPGTYTTQLCFREEDGKLPVVSIPVTFIVHSDDEVAVSFDNKGVGDHIDTIVLSKGIEFKDAYKSPDWPHPQPDGYTLEGWYYDYDCTDYPYSDETIDSDLTLYANWYHCPDAFNFHLYNGDPQPGDHYYDYLGIAAEDEHIGVPYANWCTLEDGTMIDFEGDFENGKTYYIMVSLEARPDDYLFEFNPNTGYLRYKEITLNGRDVADKTQYVFAINKHYLTMYLPYTLSNGPSLILQNMSTDGITLSWSAMEGYSKYELYRDGVKIKTVTGTSYTDDIDGNVKWGQLRHMDTWYTYKVRGVNGTEHTDFSEEEIVLYNPFADVSPVSDFYPYIVWAYNNQIVNGIEGYNNIFAPEGDCERMNFCIMLWKIKNKPNPGKKSPFKDLGGLSTNNVKAITWCYNKKIVAGYTKTQFKPHNKITRAQLAIMIWKMAGKPGVEGMSCPYTDIEVREGFTANNQKAVIWCYNKGLISSITGDKFEPDLEGTRALLTEMMYGYVHL